jgi:uncharacterized protein
MSSASRLFRRDEPHSQCGLPGATMMVAQRPPCHERKAMRTLLPPSTQSPPDSATPPLDVVPDVRRALLELARVALLVATGRAGMSSLARALEHPVGHDEPAAAFVTLTEHGRLRGCVGTLDSRRPLRQAVAAAAISAALDDPRFAPVAADELPAIHIEISVLGPTRPLDDSDAFQPGLDGVIVERQGHRALLLPQVATDSSWDAAQMFDAVCRKAGLPADAWHDRGTRLSTFRTVRFGGPAVAIGDPKPGAKTPSDSSASHRRGGRAEQRGSANARPPRSHRSPPPRSRSAGDVRPR